MQIHTHTHTVSTPITFYSFPFRIVNFKRQKKKKENSIKFTRYNGRGLKSKSSQNLHPSFEKYLDGNPRLGANLLPESFPGVQTSGIELSPSFTPVICSVVLSKIDLSV